MFKRISAQNFLPFGVSRLVCLVFAMTPIAGRAAEDATVYKGMTISTAKSERHCFDNLIQAYGFFVPKKEVNVRPPRDGQLIGQVLVEKGDVVVADQILARLVSPPGAPSAATTLKSPTAGTVVDMAATIGTYAAATSGPPTFKIIADSALELKADVFVSSLSQIKIDQKATVYLLGIGSLQGSVASIGTQIDPMTQLGTVDIRLETDSRLRSGAFARAEINAGTSCGLSVPLSAVFYGTEGPILQVVNGDHIETRHVEVGLLDKGLAEIRDGISETDLVVAYAGAFLREGDRVRPVMAEIRRP